MAGPLGRLAGSPTIALDVTAAMRQGGGIGRYTRELARELLRRDPLRYRLLVADRVAAMAVRQELGARAAVAVRTALLPSRLLTIVWHRLRVPFDVARMVGAAALLHAPDFLAPPTRLPTVLTVHDLSFLVHPDRADPALARFLGARVGPAVGRAAHVVVDSACTGRDLVDLCGIAPDRVSVAYPGVGSSMRPVTDAATLEDLRRRHDLRQPFVLGLGTMEPRKDWPTLVRAFEAAAVPGVELVLAGGAGWRTESIERALAETRAPVRRLGFVADADLPALYSAAAAFAYPSVYEGFGLPPLEAMACGTPTVVADASSLTEVVGDAALKVPPGDVGAWSAALRRIVTDDGLRAEFRTRGPEQAARFTWTACAETVEAAYAIAMGQQAQH